MKFVNWVKKHLFREKKYEYIGFIWEQAYSDVTWVRIFKKEIGDHYYEEVCGSTTSSCNEFKQRFNLNKFYNLNRSNFPYKYLDKNSNKYKYYDNNLLLIPC